MSGENEQLDQEVEVSAEELQEASEMGWQDKDSYKGKPEDWVDAKTFLERGRQLLPVVNANNRKLREEIRARDAQLRQLQGGLQAANAAIAALEEANADDVKEQVEAARKEMQTELAAALRDGDHAGAAELTAKIAELGSAEEAAGGDKKTAPRKEVVQEMPQEIRRWFDENPEYKMGRKAALATAISDELRTEGNKDTGTKFLDEVKARVEEALEGKRPSGTSKVAGDSGGQNRRNGGGGSEKTYADLPADAKAACDKMASRLVGENRKHKTIDSWRKSYARQYFAS